MAQQPRWSGATIFAHDMQTRRTIFLATAGAMTAGVVAASNAAQDVGMQRLASATPGAPGSVQAALARRQSVRSYAPEAVPLQAVSELLWAGQGITHGRGLRTAPSAGALYPLELHLVARRVETLPTGIYRYRPAMHAIEMTSGAEAQAALGRAAGGQDCVAQAPALIVIGAVPARTAAKYGARADRYVAFEAGAAAQNIALRAVSLGLGSVVVGAFDDDAVAQALHWPAGMRPLAIMPVGRPA